MLLQQLFFFSSQLLHADKRREYLYQLQEFMVTDNSRNWRFRYELAEYVSSWEQDAFALIRLSVLGLAWLCTGLIKATTQLMAQSTELTVLSVLLRQLILIIELYSHYDVYDYLRQIALTLCSDKVSEVRWISYKLVSLQRLIRACFLHFPEDL